MSKRTGNGDDLEDNSYDSLEMIAKEISRFNDQYTSFTTGKTYTDLVGKTASGLLKDAAARTTELSSEDLEKHNYALEVFGAFCMYFCATRIKSDFRKNYNAKIGEVILTVYERILDRVRRDLEEKGECKFVRNLISCSVNNCMRDLIEKEGKNVNVPDIDVVADALQEVVEGTDEYMRKERLLNLLEEAISEAADKGILTENEVMNICWFYGFGEGFPRLQNQEIAAKLKCSQGRATTMRKNALEKLCGYIRETPRLCEEFF